MTTLEQIRYCYAEPIVSTRNHWENLRAEDTLKFMEIITITNLPDPLREQANPDPAWHAWNRRLGSSVTFSTTTSTLYVAFVPLVALFAMVGILVVVTSKSSFLKRTTSNR